MIDIALSVEAGTWPAAATLKRLARRAFDTTVDEAGIALSEEAEVSLVFTNDARIRVLNARYRGKDAPTNVLSFPAPRMGKAFGPLLGDLVLSAETVVNEAAAEGLTVHDHVTHLLIHGFLHLVGYDHEREKEAAMMEGLETAILKRLGIADPYARA